MDDDFDKGSTERIRSKMLKLLALARRGEGGEKENAQRFLERMLKQHGMTMEDLGDEFEPKEFREFSYHGKLEAQLLLQIACTVLNESSLKCRRYTGGKRVAYELTRSQHLEISMRFSVLRADFKKSIDNMFLAFIHKNEITGPRSDGSEPQTESKLSKEDLAAIVGMMAGMKRANIHKAIGMKGGAS